MKTKQVKEIENSLSIKMSKENYPVLKKDGVKFLSKKVAARIVRRVNKIKRLEGEIANELAVLNSELFNLMKITDSGDVVAEWATILKEERLSRISWKDVAIKFLGPKKVAELEGDSSRGKDIWFMFIINGLKISRKEETFIPFLEKEL